MPTIETPCSEVADRLAVIRRKLDGLGTALAHAIACTEEGCDLRTALDHEVILVGVERLLADIDAVTAVSR